MRVWKGSKCSKREKLVIMRMGSQRLGCVFEDWFSEHISSEIKSYQISIISMQSYKHHINMMYTKNNNHSGWKKGILSIKAPA